MKFNSRKKSFTLIEVIVVMIIIGILVAIAVPKYTTGITQRATVTSAKAALTTLYGSVQRYWADPNAEPLEKLSQLDTQLAGCISRVDDNRCQANDAICWLQKYDQMPTSDDAIVAAYGVYIGNSGIAKCTIIIHMDKTFEVQCNNDPALKEQLEKHL